MLPNVSGQEPWSLHAISETLSAITKTTKVMGKKIGRKNLNAFIYEIAVINIQ